MSDGDPFRVSARERPRPRSAPGSGALAAPVSLRAKAATAALRARGIETVGDLLETAPRTYRDYGADVVALADVRLGEEVSVRARVLSARERPTRRRGLRIVQAELQDDTGVATAVWFNQRYLAHVLEPGQTLQLRAEARAGRGGGHRLELLVREHEILAEAGEGVRTVGLVPVYDASRTLPTRALHDLVRSALVRAEAVPEPLPARLRVARSLPLRRDAIVALHAPQVLAEAQVASRRLAYEELVLLQLALQERRARLDAGSRAEALPAAGELVARFRDALPFALTGGQRTTMRQIDRDLSRARPMRRLLIGDVGSGKTVVAVHAMLRAVEAGGQAVLLAPTETLAQQHAATVRRLVEPLALDVELVTSDVPAREKRVRLTRLASGDAPLGVGTHALLQRGVEFERLLVCVVDEQHRFGVEQRAALTDAHDAHTLHMTATPIPRSLALALYGDLDVSELRELPAGRMPVVTRVVAGDRREDCYRWLVREWEEHGRQAYVVCALVEEGETAQARAAEQVHAQLARALAPLRVGLLHGRLRAADKREAMRAFAARETQVLVATTVIEVGIDVPNATAIVIEDADRFGLSQLHQLRGRVGRGAERSYCFLFESPQPSELGTARLRALVEHASGFRLAELDLRMRGEGELAGSRQSGRSDLRFARLTGDPRMAARARADARLLERRGLVDATLRAAYEERFGAMLERIGRA